MGTSILVPVNTNPAYVPRGPGYQNWFPVNLINPLNQYIVSSHLSLSYFLHCSCLPISPLSLSLFSPSLPLSQYLSPLSISVSYFQTVKALFKVTLCLKRRRKSHHTPGLQHPKPLSAFAIGKEPEPHCFLFVFN